MLAVGVLVVGVLDAVLDAVDGVVDVLAAELRAGDGDVPVDLAAALPGDVWLPAAERA